MPFATSARCRDESPIFAVVNRDAGGTRILRPELNGRVRKTLPEMSGTLLSLRSATGLSIDRSSRRNVRVLSPWGLKSMSAATKYVSAFSEERTSAVAAGLDTLMPNRPHSIGP